MSKKKFVAELVLGGGLCAFALTEPEAGSDAPACRTTAVRDGEEYVINGRKCFITNAHMRTAFP
jgi:butyryl-CoA dehydrogenase